MPSEHRTTTRSGSAKQAIARGVVALFKEHIGRGPTTSRAYINDDLVTVLLRETLTDVERTLDDAAREAARNALLAVAPDLAAECAALEGLAAVDAEPDVLEHRLLAGSEPARRPAASAPQRLITVAMTTAEKATTEPMDRSIPPLMITNVIPSTARIVTVP